MSKFMKKKMLFLENFVTVFIICAVLRTSIRLKCIGKIVMNLNLKLISSEINVLWFFLFKLKETEEVYQHQVITSDYMMTETLTVGFNYHFGSLIMINKIQEM